MSKIYGMARVSTKRQRLDRQITNILALFPTAEIWREYYSGTTSDRPHWNLLKAKVVKGDTIVFDSVSRMSRNADEGFAEYQELFDKGINLIFINERHIDTEVYRQAIERVIDIEISSGNEAIDEYFRGNIELINKLLMATVKQQIRISFEQAEKEVTDLHKRISEGLRESAKKGTRIGLEQGTKLTTKKSVECKKLIKEHSITFGGSLTDAQVLKLCGCSRNSYFKYKRELVEAV